MPSPLGVLASNYWTPQDLGLLSLYDHHAGGTTSSTPDTSGNANTALAFAASTAAPTHLAAPGSSPYGWWPGVINNHISTPHSSALGITGDIDLRARINPALTSNGAVIAKRTSATSSTIAYEMRMLSTGAIRLGIYNSLGPGAVNYTSTASTSTGWQYIRSTLDVDNGSSASAADFYTSSDGTTWTPLGSQVTAAVVALSNVTGANLVLGASNNGTSDAFPGYMDFAQVRSGIAGTVVAEWNARDQTQLPYTGAYGNTWTANYHSSGLMLVLKSEAADDPYAGVVVDGVNDYATGPTGAIPAATAGAGATLFCVCRPRTIMVANQRFFSTRTGTGAGVALRVSSATEVVADVSDGTSTVTTPAVTISPNSRQVLGVVLTGGSPGTAYVFANTTIGSTVNRTGNTETGGSLNIFATSTPGNYGRSHTRVLFGSKSAAMTSTEIGNLAAYYRGGQ